MSIINKNYSEVRMEELLNENGQLKQLAQKYGKQVQQLKQRSSQHQTEIQTLLKFNQKLLNIIQKQLNGQKIKSSDIISLQPISEKTQMQSDVFQSQLTNNMMGSLLAQKKSTHFPSKNNWRGTTKTEGQSRSIFERAVQPMANIEREQQLSIVVDNDREDKQSNKISQITSLIVQFQKPISYCGKQYNLNDISNSVKAQLIQFEEIKQGSNQYYETRLKKLSEIKNNFIQLDSRQQIEGMIQNLQTEEPIKNILKAYVHQV